MKILMISTNRLGFPQYVLPIGIAAVASYIESIGHKVSFLDLCFVEDNEIEDSIKTVILKEQPDIIGVNIRNYCTFMDDPPLFFLPFIKEVVAICKSSSKAPVILGGGGFSNDPEEIMEFINADYGIYGDGEIAFKEFVSCMEFGGDIRSINGLVYLKNGRYMKNPLLFHGDINDFPVIKRDYYDNRYYCKPSELGLKTHEAVYLTRGCPFKCIYCSSRNFYSPDFRARKPEAVIQEIQMLVDRGVEEIQFIDFALNFPIGNAEKVLREIKLKNINIKWSGNIHPYPLESLSRELICLMKETGCIHLDLDTITCSETVAWNLKRPFFSKESILKVSEWCNEFDIPFSHYLLIGGPGETKETIRETLEAVESTNPTANPKVVANVGLVIGTNTELAEIALREKLIKQEDKLFFPPKFYLSDQVNDEAIEVIGKFRNKYDDWLFVGITLQNHLTDSGKVKEFVQGVKIPRKPIVVGDSFPDVILHDIHKQLVKLNEPVGKTKIFLIDSRESGPKAGPWVGNIARKYSQNQSIVLQQIAAVEKLRFFVSKDFILDHIRKESRVGNKLIDWEGKFVNSVGIHDLSEPILIIVSPENILKEITVLPQFTPEEYEKVTQAIDNFLPLPADEM